MHVFYMWFLNEYSMGNILNDPELINLHTVK